MKNRVAVVVNAFPVLSESFILNKVIRLNGVGFDVTVIAHQVSSDPSLFQDISAKKPAIRYSITASRPPIAAFRLLGMCIKNPIQSVRLGIRAAIKTGWTRRSVKAWVLALPLFLAEFDLVHFEFTGLAVTYLDAIPLVEKTKFVTSCRGAAEQITPLAKPERGAQLAKVFALMHRVHCVTEDIRESTQKFGLDPNKSFVNHPSIDHERFKRRSNYSIKSVGPYQLATVGRLHWKKGLEYGLLAVKKLSDAGYDIYYEIIGQGDDEEHLRYSIYDLDLVTRVTLRGAQPSEAVRDLLEVTDVYVHASLSEGLSNAVLEAMAMELPVVATTAGGMSEAIVDGRDGLLVEPRNSDQMFEKISMLLEDGSMRRTMGKSARRRIDQDFTLDRQIVEFRREYESLLSRE